MLDFLMANPSVAASRAVRGNLNKAYGFFRKQGEDIDVAPLTAARTLNRLVAKGFATFKTLRVVQVRGTPFHVRGYTATEYGVHALVTHLTLSL